MLGMRKYLITFFSLLTLLIAGCNKGEKIGSTPAITSTRLPASPTPSLTVEPTPSASHTSTVILTPTDIPLPEGSIIFNIGYSIVPVDPESEKYRENLAKSLSESSGLNVIAQPGPSTDMDILLSLRDGKIHMAILNALAFGYGQEHGWVEPGLV
jgi:hypothetical protein